MSTQRIVPCFWFDDQAEPAAAFYTQLFGGRTTAVSHYPEGGTNPSGKPPGSVLTVEFGAAGVRFPGLNGGPMFTITPSISLFAHAASPAEADRWFAALAEGGKVMMPLGSYPWSERYGWCQDRFGVSWQVITGARPAGAATLVPCLMFSDAVHRRAEEALRFYAEVFPGGRIDTLERYQAGEAGPNTPTDTIKHGRAVLDGQVLIAMDSHAPHGFTFSEGLSFQVACADQAEVDHYWTRLSAGGSPGPCGWLKDRFGLSWQIVPTRMTAMLTSPDTAARERAFAAMMSMGKLDLAAIEAAFAGR